MDKYWMANIYHALH